MAELFDILNQQDSVLSSPLTITEAQGEVTVLEFTGTGFAPGEKIMVFVSFVSQFTSANDQLRFRFDGDTPSPQFMKEAKDANESVPFSYSFPVVLTGTTFSLSIVAWIDGPGQADVDIAAANIFIIRSN